MNYLHYELDLGPEDLVEVQLDNKANVKLLDDPNFTKYRTGGRYDYIGGYATDSPVKLKSPAAGHWHLVIDLGGYPGTVQAAVTKWKPV
jgi:hypothetical protein